MFREVPTIACSLAVEDERYNLDLSVWNSPMPTSRIRFRSVSVYEGIPVFFLRSDRSPTPERMDRSDWCEASIVDMLCHEWLESIESVPKRSPMELNTERFDALWHSAWPTSLLLQWKLTDWLAEARGWQTCRDCTILAQWQNNAKRNDARCFVQREANLFQLVERRMMDLQRKCVHGQ